jgi:anti-sigma factor RsiW
MTCAEASQQLSAYLDGELSPAVRRALEEHVASCPSCSQLLASLRGASLALRSLPPIEVGTDFRRRVLAGVDAERLEDVSVTAARRPPGHEARKRQRRWAWPTIGALGTLGATAAALLAIARGPILRGQRADPAEPLDLAIAGQLELFENYEAVQVVGEIDGPEDVQVVAELDRLEVEPGGEGVR